MLLLILLFVILMYEPPVGATLKCKLLCDICLNVATTERLKNKLVIILILVCNNNKHIQPTRTEIKRHKRDIRYFLFVTILQLDLL